MLIVKVAQIDPLDSSSQESCQVPRMIPFTHPAQKIDQVDSENKDMV